jgi:Ankyrin repeats (3 copies)
VRNKRGKTVLIAICVMVSLIIAWMFFDPGLFLRSVSIRFDWQRGSQGVSSISVEWPPLGSLYSRLIAAQARPHIASYFEKAGWKAAKGRMNVRAFCFLFVLGIDRRDAWNVEIIDPEVTPLMHAAEDGDTASTERLIAEGVNVNAQDQRGWTALMHVGMKGRATEAKALLAAGADPNVKDRDGRTAFLWAAWSCRSDVATALIDAGADIDVKDRYGSSALSSTICPGVVQEILRKAKAVH